MTVSLQTLLDRSNKNMASGTHKVVRESALELIKRAYKEGIYVQISEGHRSNTRQNELYAQGRTKSGNIVTNAKAGQSWHNYGIAIDFFLTTDDGSKAVWTVNNKWRRAAQIGKSLGFEWGGDWTSFKDYPHLQMSGGLSLSDLQAGKKPNLKSKINSKPSKPAKTSKWNDVGSKWTGQVLRLNDRGGAVKDLQRLVGVTADGMFGKDTQNAVKKAQKKAGVAVDGTPGPDTYKALTKKSKGANLSVDGKWGTDVTKGLQRVFGTPVDGKLSGQLKNSVTNALYSNTATFGSGGSVVIRAMQKKLGVSADGLLGPSTIRALQKRMGTPVDGKLSKVSPMVKELQRRLNKGTF